MLSGKYDEVELKVVKSQLGNVGNLVIKTNGDKLIPIYKLTFVPVEFAADEVEIIKKLFD